MATYGAVFGISLLILIAVERWAYSARPSREAWRNFTAKQKRAIEWPFSEAWQGIVPEDVREDILAYRRRLKPAAACRIIIIGSWIGLPFLLR